MRTICVFSVLEKSGRVNLRCSFTYDFALHESLEVWWQFAGEGGQTTRLLPEELSGQGDGRVFGTVLKGRAVYLSYPYRKVSTS